MTTPTNQALPDPFDEAAKASALAMWQAYCDMKAQCEDLREQLDSLRATSQPNHIPDAGEMVATSQPGGVPYSGADESPPVFGRRWKLAVDGFGLQRDDADGPYVHIDDALSVLHQSLTAAPHHPAQEVWGWAVVGSNQIWRGPYAQYEAESEAKRVGGACRAFALFCGTPPAQQAEPTTVHLMYILRKIHRRPGDVGLWLDDISAVLRAERDTPPPHKAEGAEPSGEKFFSYGGDIGFEEFATAEEAKHAANEQITAYRQDADREWPDEVESVCWGVIVERAQAVSEAGSGPELEGCDYLLKPTTQEPSA